MNEQEQHEHTRLAQEKLRLESELRLRNVELARKNEALRQGRNGSLLALVLLAASLGLLGMSCVAILLGRMRAVSQNAPRIQDAPRFASVEPIIIEPPVYQDARLLEETRRFAEYLRRHGANPVNAPLYVKVGENMPPGFEDYISHYKDGMTYILPEFYRDTDILFKEYAHLILISDATRLLMHNENTDVFDIEDGLTTYFPCSFNDHAVWGQASAQNKALDFDGSDLNNAFTFADSPREREVLWGGVFWELRQRLGRDTTDTLLLKAWQSFQPSDIGSDAKTAFANVLLKQDQLLEGGQHAAVIRSVLQKRKLSL